MSLMSGLGALASGVAALFGVGKASSHGSVQKATWGDYRKQEVFDEHAEQRALANAKDLFGYQQFMGPGMSMQGYRNAGLNPILVGDYNGSMPSAPTPSASPAPHDFVNNAGSLVQAGSVFANLAESLSRMEVNAANAKAIASRTDIENRLLEGRLALQHADVAAKSAMPDYYKAQVERLRSELAINEIRRAVMDSQVSLNSARQTSIWNHDMLELEKHLFDKDYKNRYLDKMHESYLDNKYFGRLYFGTIGKSLGAFGNMLEGLFQRGRLPRETWHSELP